jgi:RimJ/RimL family protein N-acetyltransferase
MADVENVALSWKLYDGPIAHQEAENQIAWMYNNHQQNTSERLIHLCLAIIAKETQDFIGWCGLDHRDPTQAHPVLFYLLKTDHWGQGLATEAARALLDYAFTELNQHRIDGRTARENIASKRVMEKIGMQYLGIANDAHTFTFTREMHTAGRMQA